MLRHDLRPRWTLIAVVMWCVALDVPAQFTEVDPDPMIESYTNFLGQGMSFVDFNQDGWDDLTLANASGELNFYAGGPTGLTSIDLGISSGTGRPISLMWLDIDNDGDRDFLHSAAMPFSMFSGGGLFSKSQVWINEGGVYVNRTAEWGFDVLENRSCTGMAFHDMNGDRNLDLMLTIYALPCSDLWTTENVMLEHSGSSFTDISVDAGIADGVQSSFQGVWVDLNGDGLQDVYVINDAGIEYDCAAANMAYLNNGDGTFTESAAALGLDVLMSSMSVTVGDPDGDGEEELFITNQSIEDDYPFDQVSGAYFDKNSAGTYAEQSAASGLVTDRWSWGAMWVDFDLDGWEDLMISTSEFVLPGTPGPGPFYDNYLFQNAGAPQGGTAQFNPAQDAWEDEDMVLYNIVRGDLNGDLRPDVAGLGLGQFAGLWLNQSAVSAPDHHALTVSVCGSHSNNEAIGTRMVLHADGHAQQRTLRAGEDLFVQHSTTQFFGLGTAAVVDSLELFWPTGVREVWYDLSVDQAYHFVEGQQELGVSFGAVLPGDSVVLSLSSPPNWTGLTLNGVALQGLEVAVPINGPAAFEWQWLNGLFSLAMEVDWNAFDTELEGCTNSTADNYNASASIDDGSCTYFSALCGEGTVWSVDAQQCVVDASSCPEDVNSSGVVGVDDILEVLSMFGQTCTSPE